MFGWPHARPMAQQPAVSGLIIGTHFWPNLASKLLSIQGAYFATPAAPQNQLRRPRLQKKSARHPLLKCLGLLASAIAKNQNPSKMDMRSSTLPRRVFLVPRAAQWKANASAGRLHLLAWPNVATDRFVNRATLDTALADNLWALSASISRHRSQPEAFG